MSTLLSGPPAPALEGTETPAPSPDRAPVGRACSSCAAPLAAGQDWCLECGAGAPDSLAGPAWRSAASVVAIACVLVLAAAAAGYAALSKGPRRPRVVIATVVQAPAPGPAAPVAPVVPPPVAKTPLPTLTAKAPPIPLRAVVPQPVTSTPAVAPRTTPTTPTTSTPTPGTTGESGSPTALLLDTNAASTYNPYAYPAAGFGDPSLAIDGEAATGWTAQVDPATAPKMAEGLLIDLKSPQRLAAFTLVTGSPGMTIQVYGANGAAAPTSITDPAWVKLTHATIIHRRRVHLMLRDPKHGFRFVTVWISRAPAASTGTAQAPGHVSINELELFPAA